MVEFVRRNSWLLAIVAALSLATTSVAWILIEQQNQMNYWVEHTLDVISESDQALICLMDCETAYRGYLITAEKEYLEPYEICYKHVEAHIARIQQLTVDNPEQQALMPELFLLARDKVAFTQRVIAIRGAADPKASGSNLIDLKPGKVLMDKFRAVTAKVRANEEKLLKNRKEQSEQLRHYVFAGIAGSTFLLLTLLLQAIITTSNYAKRQAVDRERLEKLVSEKTKQLKLSEESIRRMFDCMPQLCWTATSDGTIEFYNEGWYTYTGLAKNEELRSAWRKIVHPEDQEKAIKDWETSLREHQPFESEQRLKGSDGTYRWFLVRAVPIFTDEKTVISWIATCTDIHHRKQARDEMEKLVNDRTEQLRQALTEAEQANDLKSQFVSTISHEVRTPMSGIIGLAEYLTTMELKPEIAEVATHIHQSSKRLLEILNDLLDFSKLEAGKVEIDYVEYEPRKLIEEIAALFERDCVRKGISIKTDIAPEVPTKAYGDPQKVRQIFTNLFSNAVKFTETGSIAVQAMVIPPTSNITRMRIGVSDTGIGISPESQRLLFQPFTQGDGSMSRRFGGTGLGLSISKRYVEMLGGEIGYQSSPGEGSTFWFTVPIQVRS
jgi:PAS domain S-box-containing protein